MAKPYRSALALLLFFVLASPAQATIYASPNGSDTSPGTQAEPVQTIAKAASLAAVAGDTSIELASGVYGAQPNVTTRPAAMTTIRGLGAILPGLVFKGAANYTLDRVAIGGVNLDSKSGLTNPPRDFVIANSDITGAVRILNGAQRVRVTGNHIHDAVVGIVGPGRVSADYTSSDITIDGNVIERMTQDGIQFGDWSDVLIESNVIRGVRDPAGQIHNDDVQTTGGCARVRILGNALGVVTLSQGAGESSSAMMLQGNTPAVPRPCTDVEVRQNALNRTASTPLQVAGVAGLSVTRNVGCQSDLGGGASFGSMGGVPSTGAASWNVWRAFDVQAGSTVVTSDQLVGAC